MGFVLELYTRVSFYILVQGYAHAGLKVCGYTTISDNDNQYNNNDDNDNQHNNNNDDNNENNNDNDNQHNNNDDDNNDYERDKDSNNNCETAYFRMSSSASASV